MVLFAGRCGHGSPCDQLCYELHDGMYECDCAEGFELNKNGYSCQGKEYRTFSPVSVLLALLHFVCGVFSMKAS